MLKKFIDNFNFNEKEAKVYLAALELGRSRVSRVAKKAGLNRITAYEVLKRLIEMGIAQSAVYGGVQVFTVLSPELLVEKQESRLAVAKNILPELVLLAGSNMNKPSIAYYEGAEGIRSMYEDTLTADTKLILNVAHPQNLIKVIGEEFFSQYIKKRMRRNIRVSVLLPDAPENKKYAREAASTMREIRFFNQNKYTLPNEVLLYDNKIALFSFSAVIGIIVEDNDIAQSMKSLWQMAWDHANECTEI